jgi:nucleoside-diphosphate-sugar epimerase/predicted dehydrogenase
MNSSKILKVAIIGTGYIANLHVEALKSIRGVKVIACCDKNTQKAAEFSRTWSIPLVFSSVSELCDSGTTDTAFILTSPEYHTEIATEAAQGKMNLFIEKPMGVSSEECDELILLEQQNNIIIGVNHNAIFHPTFLRVKKDIFLNKIGPVSRVSIFQTLPLRQLESGKTAFWMFRNPGNIILEQAPHPLSQIRDLLGEFRDIKATAYERQEVAPNRFFYNAWQILVECKKGIGHIHLSFSNRCFSQNILHVTGKDGSIHADLLRNLYYIQDKTVFPDYLESFANGMRHISCAFQGTGNFANYCLSKIKLKARSDLFYVGIKNSVDAFCKALGDTSPVPVSTQDGQSVVAACEQIIKSARLQPNTQPVSINTNLDSEDILITGANGFIGTALVKQLLQEHKRVRLFVRSVEGLKKALLSPDLEIVIGDITNFDDVKKAVKGIKYVYHLAHGGGDSWNSFYQTNVLGTQRLAEACIEEKIKYFIYTSTIAVYYYGNFRKGSWITEDSPIDNKPNERSFYARSKIMAETMLMDKYKNHDLPLVIFRPGIVVGENGMLFHSGVGQWIRDNVCDYWGMGNNYLPFVLTEDVADALAKVICFEAMQGRIFNLAGDVELSAKQYVEHLKFYSRRNIKASAYPISLLFLSESFKYLIKKAAGDQKAVLSYRDIYTRSIPVRFDCSKAKDILGWRPCSDRDIFVKKAIGWAFDGER